MIRWFKRKTPKPARTEPAMPMADKPMLSAKEATGDAAASKNALVITKKNFFRRASKPVQGAAPSQGAAPLPSAGPSAQRRTRKRTNKIVLGLTVAGGDIWLLHEQGQTREIIETLDDANAVPPEFEGAKVFRLDQYDRAKVFPKKLRGKALRNAMLRDPEIQDIPISLRQHGIRWYTRKQKATVYGQAVHPLALALWRWAQKEKWDPKEGIVLRMAVPVGHITVWMFLAVGRAGIGTPQISRIPSGNDRPVFSAQSGAGILGKDYAVRDVDTEAFLLWCSATTLPRYPQSGEMLGIPKPILSKMIFGAGAVCVLAGLGLHFYGVQQVTAEKARLHNLTRQISGLHAEQQRFILAHIPQIALLQRIPVDQDIRAAQQLWKPGTTAVLAVNQPLATGAGQAMQPLIAEPGAHSLSTHSAQIAIRIPPTKNTGPGQSYWVSHTLLNSVIHQPTRKTGFHLTRIQTNPEGKGYVVIYSRH